MKFEETSIPGAFLIHPEPFEDERGVFRRAFCVEEFSAAGITPVIAQSNISENRFRSTLRGFHYQLPPHGEGKTLTCLKGSIHDIIVDVRPESPTYMKWQSVELSAANRLAIHVPPGCANAFLTREDDTTVQYFSSHPYTPSAERGIRYNDPAFDFLWPEEPQVVSDKDRSHPDYVRHR